MRPMTTPAHSHLAMSLDSFPTQSLSFDVLKPQAPTSFRRSLAGDEGMDEVLKQAARAVREWKYQSPYGHADDQPVQREDIRVGDRRCHRASLLKELIRSGVKRIGTVLSRSD